MTNVLMCNAASFILMLQGAQMTGSEATTKAPVQLGIPSAIVSSQSLPAVVSLDTLNILPAATTVTKTSTTLTGTNAILAAFGLSLIPTLAVSIPFFLRRGRQLQQDNVRIPQIAGFLDQLSTKPAT